MPGTSFGPVGLSLPHADANASVAPIASASSGRAKRARDEGGESGIRDSSRIVIGARARAEEAPTLRTRLVPPSFPPLRRALLFREQHVEARVGRSHELPRHRYPKGRSDERRDVVDAGRALEGE